MKTRSILLIGLLCLLLTGCGGAEAETEVALSYQVPLIPLQVTVDRWGKISLSTSYSIATPIGTFDLSASRSVASLRDEHEYPVLIIRIDDQADIYQLEPNNTFEIDFQENGFYRIINLKREDDGDLILELESLSSATIATSGLDFSLEPSYGYDVLTKGFGDYGVYLVSGGEVDVNSAVDAGCAGFAAVPPDFDLYWDGSGQLGFYFEASSPEADTTLIINDPYGNWLCNDDADGYNPALFLEDAAPGLYDIWIGSYEYGEYAEGTLWIGELQE